MYLQFYGFKEAPFNLTPDSKFLFLSHRHQEALAALLFGIQERKGFICLTGEIGCGKTTICRAMLSQLDREQVKTCVVLNSYLTDLELLKTINEGFGLPAESDSKKELLDKLNNFLIEEFSEGRNVGLIIDEAQNLRPETLEQIRMISNLETETAKLIQIVLIGQPELRRTLALPELEQLNQRITVRYHISPLDENEIPDYIRHRLAVAEPQVEISFTPQAYRLIYHFSRGVPRRINVICDRAMLVGYIQGTFNIDDKIVQRAVTEVRGEMVDTSSSAGGAGAAEILEPVESGSRWFGTLAKMALLLLLVAGAAMIGNYWADRGGLGFVGEKKPPAEVATAKDPAKTPATQFPVNEGEPVELAGPLAREVSTAEDTPESTPVASSPTATPPPTPSPTPVLYDNWTYDADNVLRVGSPQLSEVAAFLALIREWGMEIDLEPFRDISPENAAGYDMLETVKQLNFSALDVDTLEEALRLNLPLLVRLKRRNDIAPYGVIVSMTGESLEFIDPIHGKKNLRRAALDPLIERVTVLFQDPQGLTGAAPGESSERVLRLQSWLAQEGMLQSTPDGKYGTRTREAVQSYQRDKGLKETGVVDALTAAIISAELNPQRPRLF